MKNSEINALFKQFLTFLFFLWVHSTFPSTSWNSWIKFRLFSENARINPKDVSISEPAYRAGSAVCGPDPSDQHVQELPQRSRRLIGNFLLCLTSKFPYLSHHFIFTVKVILINNEKIIVDVQSGSVLKSDNLFFCLCCFNSHVSRENIAVNIPIFR